jgi:hypothetical protein
MWLQATFTAQDLHDALAKLTPLRIALDSDDPERCLWLGKPSEVFLSDEGVHITTRGQVRWDVAGLTVPVTLRTLRVALTPSIEDLDGEEALVFGLRVVEADLTALPSFLDRSVVSRVNDALARPQSKLVWRFLDTLDFNFALPDKLEPNRRMSLFARWGKVRVTDEALTLVVSWGTDTEQDPASEPLTPPDPLLDEQHQAELQAEATGLRPVALNENSAVVGPERDSVELSR